MAALIRRLHPAPPFDFDLTAGYHTYFQGRSGADTLEGGVYRRALELDGRLALACVYATGSADSPELTLELRGDGLSAADGDCAAAQVGRMLGIGQALARFYALAEFCPVLSRLVRRFRGLHLPCTATLFEGLVLAVLGQQISAGVARMMRRSLIERFGARIGLDGEVYYAFPRPETLLEASLDELRGLKLTQRKAEYVRGIAAAALAPGWGELDGLPDGEIVRRLTALRGVGGWTAQWALVRGLARPDGLPLGDLALRRAVSRLWLGGAAVNDAEVAEVAESWRPWRSYATAYLFAGIRTGAV